MTEPAAMEPAAMEPATVEPTTEPNLPKGESVVGGSVEPRPCVDPASEMTTETISLKKTPPWRWFAPTLPLVVYLLTGLLEPARVASVATQSVGMWERFATVVAIPFDYYPAYYCLRVGLTVAALLVAMRGVRNKVAGDWGRWRWSAASLGLGVIGTALWVVLCQIPRWLRIVDVSGLFGNDIAGWVETALGGFGAAAARTGFNPFHDMPGLTGMPGAAGTLWLVVFLTVRFSGLAIIVPLAEEFFLRGFLVRFVQREAWWEVPIGVVSRAAIVAMLVYAIITHPGEWLAAVVWFSLVTWWCQRTGSIWSAVQLHMATNFTLGLYIVLCRQWHLW